MKPILAAITILATGLLLGSAEVGAGPRRAIVAPRASSAVTNLPYGVGNGVGVQRRFYGAYPYYYQPYYPPVAVVSPYAPSYILAPTVVANQPYFCVLHNEGFFSRIGLIDHLAGTHKIPLDAATDLCPDGGSCIFPSY